VGGCAGNANDGGTPPRGSQPTIGHNDINPQPPDKIKNGGTVQWPVDELATNWNENELDGANTSGKPMVDAVVPALFRARPDGVIEPEQGGVGGGEIVEALVWLWRPFQGNLRICSIIHD